VVEAIRPPGTEIKPLTSYVKKSKKRGRPISKPGTVIKYLSLAMNSSREVFMVLGRPGAGKTSLVLRSIKRAREHGNNRKILIVTPLHALRDSVSRRLTELDIEHYVLRSRPELCPMYDGEENVLSFFAKCPKCSLRKEKKCPYYNQYNEIKDHNLIVTTFSFMPIIAPTWEADIVIVDEADSLIQFWASGIDKREVNLLLETLPEKEAKRVKEFFETFFSHDWGDTVYFRKPWLPASKVLFLLTATIPRVLEHFVVDLEVMFYNLVGRPWNVNFLSLAFESNDVIISLNEHFYLPAGSKWLKLAESLTQTITAVAQSKGLTTHIICRSNEQHKRFYEYFKKMGFNVLSELYDDKPDYSAKYDVILTTVSGKWFRGVSLPEADVIIGFYQAGTNQNFKTPKELDTWFTLDPKIRKAYVNDITQGLNLQALFRCNRKPQKPHLVILFDGRLLRALNKYAKPYLKNSELIKLKDIRNVAFQSLYYLERYDFKYHASNEGPNDGNGRTGLKPWSGGNA